MKKFLLFSLAISIILCLSGCQTLWYFYLNCVVDPAPARFTFEKRNKALAIALFTSYPLYRSNEEFNRLIIVVHGAGLNAGKSFETGKEIAELLKVPENQFLVIAPQFLEGTHPGEKGLLFWDEKWKSGGVSISEKQNKGLPVVSSFEVMDSLIQFVMEKQPNINHIIILGHSAGGQFVARYALINKIHEECKDQGVSIHYVSANASSYLYLDETRYQLTSNGEVLQRTTEELTACQDYNTYKYGLESLYGDAKKTSKQDIRARIITRPLLFLLGSKDTERSWSLDKSCQAETQGRNRYERALLYKHHLKGFTDSNQNSKCMWITIPAVGHDSKKMFTHRMTIHKLNALIDD